MPCKRFEPHFTAAARRLAEHDPPVMLGSIDVPKNMELTKRFGLKTDYPYLVMIRHGKVYNYTGPKEEDGIVEYMIKQAGPSSVFIEDVAAVRKFVQSSTTGEPKGFGFFSSETSASALKTFLESGNLARLDLKLGHTTDPSIAQQLLFPINSVVVFHPHDLVTKYEAGFTVIHDVDEGETPESLMAAYQNAMRPLVGQMTLDNHMRAYKHRPLLVAYYDVNWDWDNKKDTLHWHSLIADVAVKYKDTELAFAIANEGDFAVDLRALGMSSWGEDVAVGLFAPGPKKYRLLEELTKDSLKEFVDSFLEGSLEPYYSSETPPKKGFGPVRTIVGTTFKKIVYDYSKNVVVLFCIPTLPKCKEASQWFSDAAKMFYKVDKNIVFGDINVELNDIPFEHFKFDDLPTLFFSPETSKGETDLIRIDPVPGDDSDLLYWLNNKAGIRPPQRNEL
jgi:protein disulfide-isomerase A4